MSKGGNGNVVVRRVTADDITKVGELIRNVMEEEFPLDSKAYAHHDIDDPVTYYGGSKDIFLVAEKDGEIIGTVAVKEDASETALLRRIFIKKGYRGKGYGAMLLNKAMDFCFSHSYQTVVFRGTDKMQNALRLCLKKGFKEEDILASEDLTMCVLIKNLSSADAGT